jgi:hypothetical protein
MPGKTQTVNVDEFGIGDYLTQFNLTSADYAKIAEQVNYSVSSLKTYEAVAKEFPSSRRQPHLAWGVYKHLSRVPNDDGWQDKFLAEHPNATAGQAERAVNLKIRADRGTRTGSSRDVYRDTAIVDSMSATLEVQPGAGMGRLILSGPEVAEFRHNEFAGTFEIEFKFVA